MTTSLDVEQRGTRGYVMDEFEQLVLRKYTRLQKIERRSQSEQTHKVKTKSKRVKHKRKYDDYHEEEEA